MHLVNVNVPVPIPDFATLIYKKNISSRIIFFMKNFLSQSEKKLLKRQHKQERDKRICDRIKAVLLYDKGWTLMQISEALLLSDNAVRQHIREYKELKKLKPENGGSIEKISISQSCELENHLSKHTYLYVKDIIAYVKSTYDISYTVAGMCCWLKRHNFTYKKPSLIPGKADKEQQIRWIAKYEKLKQELTYDETICFMDGVHPTHNTQLFYGWIRRGVRKEIPSNTGRSRLNLSGSIDIMTKKLIIQEDQTLNAKSTVSFLQKIETAFPSKKTVHLFCDNARYYRNKAVMEYLKASKIKLHFLPPYSPNLNPIERLWKWMKECVMYNVYYEQFDDFKLAVLGFLEKVSSSEQKSHFGQKLINRIRDKFKPIGSFSQMYHEGERYAI